MNKYYYIVAGVIMIVMSLIMSWGWDKDVAAAIYLVAAALFFMGAELSKLTHKTGTLEEKQ